MCSAMLRVIIQFQKVQVACKTGIIVRRSTKFSDANFCNFIGFIVYRITSMVMPKTHLSQAAACDGTKITTTANGQDVAPGTLPIY